MKTPELIAIAAGNLWRTKLRSGLTIAGVVVAIAALVTMLSFAAGMQRNVAAQFKELDLFRTLHVMPPAAEGAAGDSSVALDDSLLARIGRLEGVTLAYPQDAFDARLELVPLVRPADDDSSAAAAAPESTAQGWELTAQVLPAAFARARDPGEMLAGHFYADDERPALVVSARFARRIGIAPDSLVGRRVTLQTAGLHALVSGIASHLLARLGLPPEAERVGRELLSASAEFFGRSRVALDVVGVAELESGFGFRLHDAVVSPGGARSLDRIGFGDPFELLAELNALGRGGYALGVVTLGEGVEGAAIREQIEALGLRTYSFVEELEEIRRQFVIFDLMIAVIGLVALVVASLGIVNTMVMSILERTREIGILKALGARGAEIRALFIAEASLLGLLGAGGGLLFGWGVSRVGSWVIGRILIARELPPIDMFHLPVWLAGGAILFGLAISVLAGLYPAGRAARIDPVRALRQE